MEEKCEEEEAGRGFLLVGAAGGFDRDAGKSGGPAEQVVTFHTLVDKLRHPLKQVS